MDKTDRLCDYSENEIARSFFKKVANIKKMLDLIKKELYNYKSER